MLAYVPDHEPYLGGTLVDHSTEWISGFDVAFEADLLLHDAQYTEDEYPRGSAGAIRARRTPSSLDASPPPNGSFFHHDPFHSDDDLELIGAGPGAVGWWSRAWGPGWPSRAPSSTSSRARSPGRRPGYAALA